MNKRARDEEALELTELRLPKQFRRGELHFTLRDRQHFLQMEQWVKVSYDLVDGISVSHTGMGNADDSITSVGASFKPVRKTRVQERYMFEHSMPSVEVRSAEEPTRLAAKRNIVKGTGGSRSAWSFASEKGTVEERPEQGRTARLKGDSRDDKDEGNDATKTGCRKQKTAFSSAERAGGSGDSGSSEKMASSVTYTSGIASILVTDLASLTTCQGQSTADWNEYGRPSFPKYVAMPRTRLGTKKKLRQCGLFRAAFMASRGLDGSK